MAPLLCDRVLDELSCRCVQAYVPECIQRTGNDCIIHILSTDGTKECSRQATTATTFKVRRYVDKIPVDNVYTKKNLTRQMPL